MMKTLIFGFAMIISLPNYGQKISADKVPAAVIKSFKDKFPNAKEVKWEKEKNEYEGSFDSGKEEMSAEFDETGKWLETEMEIKETSLPPAVKESLKKEFAGYKVEHPVKLSNNKCSNCYEVEVEKSEKSYEVVLSQKGEIVSREVKSEKD
jgi:hypothetical protein